MAEKGRLVCLSKSQALGWREEGKNLMKDRGVAAQVGGEEKNDKLFRVSLFVALFNCQIAPLLKTSVAWYL